MELMIDLDLFCASLDQSPVFSKMPRFEDEYACLWAMFLKDGEPGTEAWDNDWLEASDLRALPLEGDSFMRTSAFQIDGSIAVQLIAKNGEKCDGKYARVG